MKIDFCSHDNLVFSDGNSTYFPYAPHSMSIFKFSYLFISFLSIFLFSFYFKQICLIVHNLYDDNMAVLLYIPSQRVWNAAGPHSRLFDNDFAVRRVDHIHRFLQIAHDDVLWHLCASVHFVVLKLVVLWWNGIQRSRQLFHLRHLHHLHLHGHSTQTVSMPNYGCGLLYRL